MHQGQTDDSLNFSKKIGFDIQCKLSPIETVCMHWQNNIWDKIV